MISKKVFILSKYFQHTLLRSFMIRSFILVFAFCSSIKAFAQIDANSLMVIPSATTTERNGITSVIEGSLVYDTDVERLYKYTSTGWQEISGSNNTDTYVGAFQISAAGAVNVNGLPFQPTSITFVAHANVENFNINSDNGTNNNDRGIRNSFGTMNGFARQDGGSITQQVIYVGGHGNSINDISRYASNSNSIGLRYGDQNGLSLGIISGAVTSFNTDGFTVNVTYTNGTITNNGQNVRPTDINNEGIIVLYTAYK
ncbi:hypothetical protein [Aquimarina aquimarini]|uniref:hypothetical protein n=1 Tax=Aquimarina aquimarini TaxID=1191734 RepID=UPI00131F1259|nr:hypothetical protein [Aquimarina aquimarini]